MTGVAVVRTSLIVAADEDDVIGRDGGLPWRLPEDLERFKRLTTGHVMVAGRKTNDSIVERLGHPLPGRITVVVTRRSGCHNQGTVIYQPDVSSAIRLAKAVEAWAGRGEVFIIGGAEIYAQALPETERVYLTRVHDRVGGDTVMPAGWLAPFELREESARPGFTFQTYERG